LSILHEWNDMNRPHATINDVAKAAGVSISTVSRILNNKPDVAPVTRQRVLEAIATLGYTPHAQAKNLAGGRSRSIAALYPADSVGFSGLEFDFFIGMANVAGKHEFLFNLFFHPLSESELLNLYRSNRVDGLILMEIHLDDWRPTLLREHGYPFVMIGHCEDNTNISYIDLDFEAAFVLTIKHLYELGHREIGFINLTGDLRDQGYGPSVRSLRGYELGCAKYKLTPKARDARPTIDDVMNATQELLDEYPNITAITTHHTDGLIGVIRAANNRGLEVPADFSVVGVMSDKVASLLTPPLTAVSFPAQAVGTRAAQMLVQMLDSEVYEPQGILLKPRLVVRESTAAAYQRE
jgi:DNA-binding LacI/PurR family transcriptional regulator